MDHPSDEPNLLAEMLAACIVILTSSRKIVPDSVEMDDETGTGIIKFPLFQDRAKLTLCIEWARRKGDG